MSALAVNDLTVTFDSLKGLDGVDLQFEDGTFFTVVGPTNAGKSTLLKTIAGVERPSSGTVRLGGRDITKLEPRNRRVSLLFQNIALFPTLTGFANIAFPLRRSGKNAEEVKARVEEIAGMLRVSHVLGRLPRTFSGGEQQRVAIGRALAAPADLLMLDEPLTNLDARIRIALRLAFKELHRDTGQTILYVTHDQTEAVSLSDRIGVLNQGQFEQIGAPDDLYRRPATEFVARFIGSPPMNLIPAQMADEQGHLVARAEGFAIPIVGAPEGARPQEAAIGVRPETIAVAGEASDTTPFPAEVTQVEHLGGHNVLNVALGRAAIKVRTRADHPVARAGHAFIGMRARAEHILDRRTGRFVSATGP